jgi:hypothetical protein
VLSQWTGDLLVYGMDLSCADLKFGRLAFFSDDVSAVDEYRSVLAELLGRKQMFARLETAAIDEQYAVHRVFAIALESVVLGRDTKSELTHQLATRVAHLIGNGPSGRKHVAIWVNNLYDRRSIIVHTGEYGVSRTKSGLIQFYCTAVLWTLVLSLAFDGSTTNEQMNAWFKDRMLEGPYRVGPARSKSRSRNNHTPRPPISLVKSRKARFVEQD